MEKKYYFISAGYIYNSELRGIDNLVTVEHPFKWLANLNKLASKDTNATGDTYIISWQLISKEEYDLYKKLEL